MVSPITTGDGGPMAVWGRVLDSVDPVEIMEAACEKVADGWSLRRIAHANRYPALQFIAWVESDDKRMQMYRLALKAAAEFHVDKVVECVETATIEDYQLKRFQSGEHRWLASKFDRQRFGDDKQAHTVENNITIIHESA